VAILERVVELGHRPGERTQWTKTVGPCHKLLPVADVLWTFLKIKDIEPTNNAAERALRQSVIQRKISHCDQSLLIGGRGVIFPGSYRNGFVSSMFAKLIRREFPFPMDVSGSIKILFNSTRHGTRPNVTAA
jgi:hypothetical protein